MVGEEEDKPNSSANDDEEGGGGGGGGGGGAACLGGARLVVRVGVRGRVAVRARFLLFGAKDIFSYSWMGWMCAHVSIDSTRARMCR